MTKRKLFMGAASITVAIGAAFFVTANNITFADAQTTYVIGQYDWQSAKGTSPIYVQEIQNDPPKDWKQFWKDWVTGTFPGASTTVMGRPTLYAAADNVTTGDQLKGKARVAIEDGYLISTPYQFKDATTGDWQHLSFRYKGNKNEFRFYYRVADDNGITDPSDSSWVEVTGLNLNNQYHVQKLALNKTGKTFQYKINLKDTSSVATGVTLTAREKAVVAMPTTPDPEVTIPEKTPIPSASPIVRRQFGIWQRKWMSEAGKTVASVNSGKPSTINTKCAPADDQVTTFGWTGYTKSAKIGKSIPQAQGDKITATVGSANIDSAYLISQPFTIDLLNADNTINWSKMNLSFAREAAGSIKVYYRVFNDPAQATDSATASDWVEVADPNTLSPVKDNCENGFVTSGYRIDKTGKYFQYKVHLAKVKKNGGSVNQSITKIALYGAEMSNVVVATTPTPTASISANPTGNTPSPEVSGMGKITLMSRVLSDQASPTPTPSSTSSIALPNLTTPSPTTVPTITPNPNDTLCGQDVETAPNVGLKIKQLTNGSFSDDDQQTDDEGIWQGMDGEVDEFQNGNYQITFGAYQNSVYKLVAFCVTPDDGLHYYKTQADPATGKITIIVRAGSETKVVALYGKRSQPHITMEKMAIDSKTLEQAKAKQQRVLNRLYPGQQFMYRINYTNTSDTAAKDIVIYDVIPKEFEVSSDLLDDTDGKYGVTVEIDAQRRNVIKKTITELKPQETGVIYIPVTLRSDAFDDI